MTEGFPDGCATANARNHQEILWDDSIQCRYPPVNQRVPFVRGCVPENADSSHDTNRVRMFTASGPTDSPGRPQTTGGKPSSQPCAAGFFFGCGMRSP